MPTPIELHLTELARAAREANLLAVPLPDPVVSDASPVAASGFDDEVLLWALASSTCGGIEACLGTDAEA